jgi:N-dimethylarginine dimethylaminohydrolase
LSADLSEYAVKPRLVIVHNPTEFDSFSDFSSTMDRNILMKKFLFREHPDINQMHEQHSQFVRTLQKYASVTCLHEILGKSHLQSFKNYLCNNPNHLYAHDAIITIPWIPDGYILGNMKEHIRRSESIVMAKVAELLGMKEILKIPPDLYLEGGDVIPFFYDVKRVFLMGYGPRTSRETLFFLRDTLMEDGIIDEIIGFRLADWRLNLDGCFFPVQHNCAVSHADSIVDGMLLRKDVIRRIDPLGFFKKLGFDIISTSRDESYKKQACNFCCLGNNSFVAYNITERINNILRNKGVDIIGINGDQLVKGNGGPHCMTRPIY